LRGLAARRTPVIACVSVCGTTEESAVDRLDQLLEVRERARAELGMAFHLHSDACYGGYAAAVTWRADGTRRTAAEVRTATGTSWPSDEWMRAMTALSGADSVTIDPHKLGYVPYPAGAFLLRDRRARDLVAIDPPYLTPPTAVAGGSAGSRAGGSDGDELFLGRFIFEGSKPGAAAAAVWLSHKVLPLDERGYGYLIERTVIGARRLHAALGAAQPAGFDVVVLPEPDINIVCFVVRHPQLSTLTGLNALNEAVYARMSHTRDNQPPEYIITRTRLRTPMYDGAIAPILEALGTGTVEEWASDSDGLVVLRSTVMDPFLASPTGGVDHVAGFVAALGRACASAFAELRAGD
jgi:glutamate/tyrosine decarboxylase-like PLP-dependent enzyme